MHLQHRKNSVLISVCRIISALLTELIVIAGLKAACLSVCVSVSDNRDY